MVDATIVDRGRRLAASRMTSRCTIWRPTGRMVQDEATGRELPQWERVYTRLACRLGGTTSQRASASRREVRSGLEVEVSTRVLHLPVTTTGLRDNDWVEMTSGDSCGLVFRIVESDRQDQATSLRLPVIADDRPTNWT